MDVESKRNLKEKCKGIRAGEKKKEEERKKKKSRKEGGG